MLLKKIFYLGLGVVGLMVDALHELARQGERRVQQQAPTGTTAVSTRVATTEPVPAESVATAVVAQPATAVGTNGNGSIKLATKTKEDDLTAIKGIGPTFANRLKAAGIKTYQALANATVDQLKAITQVADWQADPAEWIEQARAMA